MIAVRCILAMLNAIFAIVSVKECVADRVDQDGEKSTSYRIAALLVGVVFVASAVVILCEV